MNLRDGCLPKKWILNRIEIHLPLVCEVHKYVLSLDRLLAPLLVAEDQIDPTVQPFGNISALQRLRIK